MCDVNGKAPLHTYADFLRAYEAQADEIVDAIAATITNARGGLNWLRAQPLDLEEVRRALDSISRDGKRAVELVLGLRALVNGVPKADGSRSQSFEYRRVDVEPNVG